MSNSSKSDAPKSKASSKLNRSVKSVFITLGVGWCFNYHKDRGYLAKWGWGCVFIDCFCYLCGGVHCQNQWRYSPPETVSGSNPKS